MDTPTNEPTLIRAGDSVTWQRDLPEYSAAVGWVLKYRLLYPSGAAVGINSTGAGTLHTVNLSSSATGSFTAGSATLVAWVENAGTGARQTLETQPVTILPDLTGAANYDNRTSNQIALGAAKAALEDYLKSGRAHIASYDIAGRQFTFRSSKDVIELIQHYERAVASDNARLAVMQGGSPGRVFVRM